MVQFCIAYAGILSKHELCATGTTGKLVSEATGLKVQRFLTGKQGGDQQIGARITYNEIDMVLFFRDPMSSTTPQDGDVMTLLRLCDINNVPMANKCCHREMLILGLEREILTGEEYQVRQLLVP